MWRVFGCTVLVVVLSAVVLGQSAEKPVAFDTADVHVSPPRTLPIMVGGVLLGGKYEIRNATMVDLIKTAYDVSDDKIFGGPNWLETDRFDVIALAPGGTTPAVSRVMLQGLLQERFKLAVHKDSKTIPSYVLNVGKNGHKLKEASGSGLAGCQGQPPNPPPAPGTLPPYVVLSCHSMSMTRFLDFLHQVLPEHPVVDSTNLDGSWDFDLKVTPPPILAAVGADGISIFDALDKQLGLKLDVQNVPGPVIVVDNVNRKPTDNLPDVGKRLPDIRPEFEVAEVKPSPPGSTQRFIRPSPGGRWDAEGPLRDIIGFAFDILPNLRSDLLVAPKWTETERYTMVAKAPAAGPATGRGGASPATDDITLRQMVRALMTDRFKLTTHYEDRQATVYTLSLKSEGKLKTADPNGRSSCKPDPSAAPRTPGAGPMVAIRCQNTTMAELAHNLPLWAGGYLEHPAVDTTRLQGGFDFVLYWTPRALLENAPRPTEAPGGLANAADPGGLSVFEAIQQELGLKLEVQKHSISVLVVDNVERLQQ